MKCWPFHINMSDDININIWSNAYCAQKWHGLTEIVIWDLIGWLVNTKNPNVMYFQIYTVLFYGHFLYPALRSRDVGAWNWHLNHSTSTPTGFKNTLCGVCLLTIALESIAKRRSRVPLEARGISQPWKTLKAVLTRVQLISWGEASLSGVRAAQGQSGYHRGLRYWLLETLLQKCNTGVMKRGDLDKISNHPGGRAAGWERETTRARKKEYITTSCPLLFCLLLDAAVPQSWHCN